MDRPSQKRRGLRAEQKGREWRFDTGFQDTPHEKRKLEGRGLTMGSIPR